MGHPYPGLWSFKHHPWLKPMHDSEAASNVGQKAAQVGFTEWALNVSFFTLDVKRTDVLYVLPNTRPDAADFSSGRFDKALELSEHLRELFSHVQNVGHKRAGPTNLYIRGSNSRSGLMSIPVGLIVLDELDEMEQENIPLAEMRLRGQLDRRDIKISTPTIHGDGINYYYEKSTQEQWFFPCPSCSRRITLKFPDNLVVVGDSDVDPRVSESHLICDKCKAVLPHEDKPNYFGRGEYVPAFPDREVRGFTVNQMFASHLKPSIVATDYLKSRSDPSAEQVFWNSVIGVPHIVAQARISEDMVNACIGNHRKVDFNRLAPVTMGVDVGTKLHVEIDHWHLGGRSGNDVNSYARPTLLTELELDDFEQLDTLMFQFGVYFAVVDSQPEKRKAIEFANRFPGRVKLCRYPVGVNGRNITQAQDEEAIICVDRTSWLDLSLGRFKNGSIVLPIDVSRDYKQHIVAQVRVPKKDRQGNPVASYQTPKNSPDHFGHARNYAEIALPFALGLGVSSDIRG